jgi:Ca2+-binding RTX toxin-like protein
VVAIPKSYNGLQWDPEHVAGSGSGIIDAFTNGSTWFRLDVEAGTTYHVYADSHVPRFTNPTHFQIFDAKGNEVVFSPSGTYTAGGVFTATVTTSFYVQVQIDGGGESAALFVSTGSAIDHFLDYNPNTYTGVANERILAGDGDDRITLGDAIDALGGYGDDVLAGNVLDNRLDGGGGGDTLMGEGGNDRLWGGDGADQLSGGAGNDRLWGGDSNDYLSGDGGFDFLFGGAGGDRFSGYANSRLYGGTGDDYYVIFQTDATIVEKASEGLDTVRSFISLTLSDNVETGIFDGSQGMLPPLYLIGAGNDLSNDMTLFYAGELSGKGGNDRLNGSSGGDSLKGGAGSDVIRGLDGNDYLYGEAGADYLMGGTGTDRAMYSTAAAGLTVSLSNPSINTGDAKGDTYNSIENLTGSKLNDSVFGNSAANAIHGAAGNDFIKGYAGNDILTGGAGKDTFIFNTALSATTNVDRITDFSVADDTIQIDHAVFKAIAKTGELLSGYFRSNNTGLAQDANDHIIYEKDTGEIYYDSNGSTSGGAVLFASVKAGLSLTNADFFVI